MHPDSGNLLVPGSLLVVPKSVDLTDVARGCERMDVVLFHERHQSGELILREKGLDLDITFSAVSASDLIKAAAPAQVIYYVVTDFLVFF